jgi:rod shape-determining protein MreC
MAESFRQRTGWVFFGVMLAQVLLVSAQVQTRSGLPVIEAVSFGAFSRVQGTTSAMVRSVRDFFTNYTSLRGARDENAALKQQLAELEVRLQEQRALAARTAQLQNLLALKEATPLPTIAAEVIGGNPNARAGIREVTIDRGTADGVQANMAVIAPKGIVGRVIGQPAAHAARVQLMIDRNAAAGAITERARVGGLIAVSSEDAGGLIFDLVTDRQDVKPGDLIVTSGLDGIYPKGYTVGWVESVQPTEGLHLDIRVQPAVDFGSLEEVLVVLVPARPAAAVEAELADKPPPGKVK